MVKLFYRDSLWSLIVGPTIWAIHLIVSYATVAVYCSKVVDVAAHFSVLRAALGIFTVVAFTAIVIAGIQATDDWRQALNAEWAADDSTLAMRRRFVGRAAFLLSGLSAIAVIYAGLPMLFIAGCQ